MRQRTGDERTSEANVERDGIFVFRFFFWGGGGILSGKGQKYCQEITRRGQHTVAGTRNGSCSRVGPRWSGLREICDRDESRCRDHGLESLETGNWYVFKRFPHCCKCVLYLYSA